MRLLSAHWKSRCIQCLQSSRKVFERPKNLGTPSGGKGSLYGRKNNFHFGWVAKIQAFEKLPRCVHISSDLLNIRACATDGLKDAFRHFLIQRALRLTPAEWVRVDRRPVNFILYNTLREWFSLTAYSSQSVWILLNGRLKWTNLQLANKHFLHQLKCLTAMTWHVFIRLYIAHSNLQKRWHTAIPH